MTMLPSGILMNTALSIIVANRLPEKKLDNLEQIHVVSTHADPDGAWIQVELTFKTGGTGEMDISIEEFNDIPFAKLFNEVAKNEKKVNTTRWIGTGDYDVEHVEIVSCEKCHFQTIHKFDYCPNCGRKIN